jgi:hypothetical protein
MPVDSKSVTNRRRIHYNSLDEFVADAERLAATEVQMLGNWSLDQIFGHLAFSMNSSIDGFSFGVPKPIRPIVRLFFKKKFLEGPINPGFKFPAKAAAVALPEPSDVQEKLNDLRAAVHRIKTETKRAPNPGIGPLTVDEWTQFHLRHAELHMSFAKPATDPQN